MPYDFDNEVEARYTKSSGSRQWIQPLWVPINGFSRIRLLEDVNGHVTYNNYFHRMEEPRNDGNGTRRVNKFCDGLATCVICASGHKASRMFFIWTYAYFVAHPTRPADLKKDTITLQTLMGRPYWVEEINGPRLWSSTYGKDEQRWLLLKSYHASYDSLTDRDYDLQRYGEGIETLYQMPPRDKADMPEEVAALFGTLPDLSKVAKREIIALDQKDDGADKVVNLNDASGARVPENEYGVNVEDPDDINDLLPF